MKSRTPILKTSGGQVTRATGDFFKDAARVAKNTGKDFLGSIKKIGKKRHQPAR